MRRCLDVDIDSFDGEMLVFTLHVPFAEWPNLGESIEYTIHLVIDYKNKVRLVCRENVSWGFSYYPGVFLAT